MGQNIVLVQANTVVFVEHKILCVAYSAHSSLFQHILAYVSLYQPLLAYFSLFSLFLPIPAYSNLVIFLIHILINRMSLNI